MEMSSENVIRIPVSDLNRLLTCKLCLGYFQDAHTITECMHTFCRACIWSYFDRYHDGRSIPCPHCKTDIGFYHIATTKIIFDRNIQSIADKIFPADVGDSRLIQQQLQQQLSANSGESASEENIEFTVKALPDESCEEELRLPGIPKPSFRGKLDVTIKKIQKFVATRLDESLQADGVEISYEGTVLDSKANLTEFRSLVISNSTFDANNSDLSGTNQVDSSSFVLVLHYRRKIR